eukprot:ANDGO_01418.mRNA.1 hypothetical protein
MNTSKLWKLGEIWDVLTASTKLELESWANRKPTIIIDLVDGPDSGDQNSSSGLIVVETSKQKCDVFHTIKQNKDVCVEASPNANDKIAGVRLADWPTVDSPPASCLQTGYASDITASAAVEPITLSADATSLLDTSIFSNPNTSSITTKQRKQIRRPPRVVANHPTTTIAPQYPVHRVSVDKKLWLHIKDDLAVLNSASPGRFFEGVSGWPSAICERKHVSFIRYLQAGVKDSLAEIRMDVLQRTKWEEITHLIISGMRDDTVSSVSSLAALVKGGHEFARLLEFKAAICVAEMYQESKSVPLALQERHDDETRCIPNTSTTSLPLTVRRRKDIKEMYKILSENRLLPEDEAKWTENRFYRFLRVGRLLMAYPGLLQLNMFVTVTAVSHFATDLFEFLQMPQNTGVSGTLRKPRIWNSPYAFHVLGSVDTVPVDHATTKCLYCDSEASFYPPACTGCLSNIYGIRIDVSEMGGREVFATRNIFKGEILFRFDGILRENGVADASGKEYSAISADGKVCIDPHDLHRRCIFSMMNHASQTEDDCNCAMETDVETGLIFCIVRFDIQKGDPLRYEYSKTYDPPLQVVAGSSVAENRLHVQTSARSFHPSHSAAECDNCNQLVMPANEEHPSCSATDPIPVTPAKSDLISPAVSPRPKKPRIALEQTRYDAFLRLLRNYVPASKEFTVRNFGFLWKRQDLISFQNLGSSWGDTVISCLEQAAAEGKVVKLSRSEYVKRANA